MKVLLTRKIPDSAIKMLESHPKITLDKRFDAPMSIKEMIKAIKDCDAILPVIPDKITKEVIEAGKNLKVIATYSVGYDHIDIETATKNKIYVGNTPGDKTTASVAEFAMAMIMGLGTKMIDADEFCRNEKYEYWDPMGFMGSRTQGKTLGIVGFGRIGQALAKMVQGLDMKVLYFDKTQRTTAEEKDLGIEYADLNTLLTNSDYVSLHVNLTEDTKHLIGEHEFSLMKPDAILINTSRGPVVNEEALVQALKNNIIQGAGLDVFEKEPKIHPDLLTMKNVILTPHIASATREVRIQMADLAAQNIIDVLIENKPPTHLVNRELENTTTSLS